MADPPAPATPQRETSRALPMCYACGQILKGDELKCPSCGAPTRTIRKARRGGRLGLAGVFLIVLFIVTGAIAFEALMAVTQEDLGPSGVVSDQRFEVSGKVTLENETDASGVRVASSADPGNATVTDANGTYRLANLSDGLHKVRFEKDNYTTLEVRLYVFQNLAADAHLAAGNRTNVTVQNHSTYTMVNNLFNFCGALFVAIALLELGGAFACLRRRNYMLALTGGIVAVVGALPLLVVVILGGLWILLVPISMSVVATVIILRNKASFR